jgi:hypothetical protein
MKTLPVLLIAALVILACLPGCIDVSPSGSKPAAIQGKPKYIAGDISGKEKGDIAGSLILGYTPGTDMYTTHTVYFQDGKWMYFLEWKPSEFSRDFHDRYEPVLLGHIDPKTIEQYDFSRPL